MDARYLECTCIPVSVYVCDWGANAVAIVRHNDCSTMFDRLGNTYSVQKNIYIYIYTLHVYITTVQSTSQNSLCVLSPPFSLTLSAAMVSARRPDVVALETHKL